MKFRLIYPALLATALVALPSCKDDSDTTAPKPAQEQAKATQPETPDQPAAEQPAPAQQEQTPAQVPEATGNAPSPAQIAEAVTPLLADFPYLEMEQPTVTSSEEQQDGALAITASIKLKAKEDLVKTRPLSEVMDEARKGINSMANKAMQPDSLYLLQIGAAPTDISEGQREAKPLPENLQTMENALKDASDDLVASAGLRAGEEAADITATMTATKTDSAWQLSNVQINREPLEAFTGSTPAAKLPEGTRMLTEEFENELKQKVEEFNAAAKEYILTREDAARATYTEKQALVEETLRKSEAAAAARAENEKLCTDLIAEGKTYSGEWKRYTRFGTIAIFIRKVGHYDDSVQFVGSLYDPKLPAASMDISGRCEFTPGENGELVVDIEIYDGKYDPNKPTAEVFDARDSVLHLTLSKDGKMKGVMTCRSWGLNSEKAFSVSLMPEKDEKKKD